MIRYTLKCTDGHSFESWFKSAGAYEDLRRSKHLSCPKCGSDEIEKSLMAPRLTTAREKSVSPEQSTSEQSPAAAHHTEPHETMKPQADANNQPTHIHEAPAPQDMETSISKMRAHVEKTSDYVGSNFTEQARAMKDGSAPERSIYGEANLEDAKALIDEGVPVIPLPFAPKRKLN